MLSKLYISPVEADELELWQIAALLTPTAEEIAADPEELNRRIIEARYKAAREGRELDPDEVFSGMTEAQVTRVT